jgi:hypothetical protein
MTPSHRIEANGRGGFNIVQPNGNFVRTTSSGFYIAGTEAEAREALAYITQPVVGTAKRVGPHWLKSTFGVF